MDKKKLYELWTEKKSQVEISRSFPDKVMNQIYQYERQPRWFDIQQFIDIISAHSIIKNGLVVIGALIGFVRVMYMIFMILA
jgi:hypothetical protein